MKMDANLDFDHIDMTTMDLSCTSWTDECDDDEMKQSEEIKTKQDKVNNDHKKKDKDITSEHLQDIISNLQCFTCKTKWNLRNVEFYKTFKINNNCF